VRTGKEIFEKMRSRIVSAAASCALAIFLRDGTLPQNTEGRVQIVLDDPHSGLAGQRKNSLGGRRREWSRVGFWNVGVMLCFVWTRSGAER